MKKLIFCCLVVLMGACKDKKENVEPEVDYSVDFPGKYATTTVAAGSVTQHAWDVASTGKNQLTIVYTKNTTITAEGTELALEQTYNLVNIKSTGKDVFEINETVDVKQSNEKPLQQKVEGVGTKVINAAGVPQINITVKLTTTATGAASESYLEFKKK